MVTNHYFEFQAFANAVRTLRRVMDSATLYLFIEETGDKGPGVLTWRAWFRHRDHVHELVLDKLAGPISIWAVAMGDVIRLGRLVAEVDCLMAWSPYIEEEPTDAD